MSKNPTMTNDQRAHPTRRRLAVRKSIVAAATCLAMLFTATAPAFAASQGFTVRCVLSNGDLTIYSTGSAEDAAAAVLHCNVHGVAVNVHAT